MNSDPSALPPELERQLQVGSWVIVGATTVFVWNLLHSLAEDYYILFKLKFQISAAVYIVSRIASLVYTLGFTLFATYPLPNCQDAITAFNAVYPISVSFTSLLFFFRTRAIYAGRPLITYTFGFLWLCMLAGALTVSVGTSAAPAGHVCVITRLAPFVGANGIAMMVFDTSVFAAISHRLLANGRVEQTRSERVRSAFTLGGANLYSFSESLFRDGQKYYLCIHLRMISCAPLFLREPSPSLYSSTPRITTFTNTVAIVIIYAPGVAPIYRGMGCIPNVAVTNIMASRVYRSIKMQFMRDGSANRILHDGNDINVSLPVFTLGIDPPPAGNNGDEVVPTASRGWASKLHDRGPGEYINE
ncbi:hypothetical protein MSAN_00619300 [Mycena sanguinolenta]|uniref:Uncharacterized protein n=1 Tax=Mycena sanguinolenta TaxID=230812 RepID=A0A8H7DF45_9AGAR|nr:hypothetical protein MSAN_00619300 [Mycena sanguinolenta]